eukprot:5167832-Ditylum_brightwellii.AAC.1
MSIQCFWQWHQWGALWRGRQRRLHSAMQKCGGGMRCYKTVSGVERIMCPIVVWRREGRAFEDRPGGESDLGCVEWRQVFALVMFCISYVWCHGVVGETWWVDHVGVVSRVATCVEVEVLYQIKE